MNSIVENLLAPARKHLAQFVWTQTELLSKLFDNIAYSVLLAVPCKPEQREHKRLVVRDHRMAIPRGEPAGPVKQALSVSRTRILQQMR